jgi:ribosomal protein L31
VGNNEEIIWIYNRKKKTPETSINVTEKIEHITYCHCYFTEGTATAIATTMNRTKFPQKYESRYQNDKHLYSVNDHGQKALIPSNFSYILILAIHLFNLMPVLPTLERVKLRKET